MGSVLDEPDIVTVLENLSVEYEKLRKPFNSTFYFTDEETETPKSCSA